MSMQTKGNDIELGTTINIGLGVAAAAAGNNVSSHHRLPSAKSSTPRKLSLPFNHQLAQPQSTTIASNIHPLARHSITASSSSTPTVSVHPFSTPPNAQRDSPRPVIQRRRSSYPPTGTGTTAPTPDFPFGIMPSTPKFEGFDFSTVLDGFSSTNETGGTGWTPGSGAWDALLNNLDTTKSQTSNFVSAASPPNVATSSRARSDPLSDHPPAHSNANSFAAPIQIGSNYDMQQQQMNWTARIAQFGSDLAWRTALASVVEVDGTGSVSLAKILQEVWRRGGGDAVTTQCLWPSVIIALAMPSDAGPGVRIPTPSAQSAMSLQQLYNLSIRHWEPTIFSGLLGQYMATITTTATAPPLPNPVDAFGTPHFGAATPHRDSDPSQWINLTPGGWSNFLPNPTVKSLNGNFEVSASDLRRMSLAKTEVGDDQQQVRGIDEILAGMEDSKDDLERAQIAANLADQARDLKQETSSTHVSSRSNSTYQLPTPETDGVGSPSNKSASKHVISGFSPISMESPYVSAGSTIIVAPTLPAPPMTIPQLVPKPPAAHLKQRPSQLSMPNNSFIPPPPMCMFFSPAFQDLQKGKMGVWKGDLEVRGRGGGKFPVMIVGEEGTGHLWQSNLWPESLTYPLAPIPVEGCTSSMIPVSHLAREGLVPITMGMVLCNQTGPELTEFVNMVHGFHAEGVGFHLPCQTRLPIVFLPAKFNSEDPLQRLGIAFMGKASSIPALMPVPGAGAGAGAAVGHGAGSGGRVVTEKGEPKKKRRRQSAPATAATPMNVSGRGHKRKESGVGRIEEEEEGKA